MDVLDDIWAPGIDVAICGTAVGPCAAERGHHYAQRGNAFWRLLHASGLTPELLTPHDESRLPELGIGLVDIVRRFTPPDPFDVDSFVASLGRAGPPWVAFNGRVGADAVARDLGEPRPSLGRQRWTVAGAQVFVLPSSSGANQRKDHGGRPDRLSWWAELASLAATARTS
ncbi:MAG: mismatch-specific DNA-glycosylase [Aeromicrobium sp.]|nr:mismatch-specific DNA-glycosylase [Aeromicrobium sp.]